MFSVPWRYRLDSTGEEYYSTLDFANVTKYVWSVLQCNDAFRKQVKKIKDQTVMPSLQDVIYFGANLQLRSHTLSTKAIVWTSPSGMSTVLTGCVSGEHID